MNRLQINQWLLHDLTRVSNLHTDREQPFPVNLHPEFSRLWSYCWVLEAICMSKAVLCPSPRWQCRSMPCLHCALICRQLSVLGEGSSKSLQNESQYRQNFFLRWFHSQVWLAWHSLMWGLSLMIRRGRQQLLCFLLIISRLHWLSGLAAYRHVF